MRRIAIGAVVAAMVALPALGVAQEGSKAGMAAGAVKAIDKAAGTIVLEDGTQIWVSTSVASAIREGEKVNASFVEQDGRKVATEVDRRVMTTGPDGGATYENTNLGGYSSN